VSEDDPFRTSLDTGQTARAFLGIYIVGPFLVLKDTTHGTGFSALPALGAGAHLELTRLREMGHDSQASLMGVILLKVIEGTGQKTGPTAGTFVVIRSKMHHLLLDKSDAPKRYSNAAAKSNWTVRV
jgi:hypothetical protein